MVLKYEKTGKIATVTLNRPEVMNALNEDLLRQLVSAWYDFADDPDLVIMILTGEGDKAFCVGADLKERRERNLDLHVEMFWQTDHKTPMRDLVLYKPVIVAVNGWCVGGGLELALVGDIRIASDNAVFGSPEIKRGIFPGWGATQRLPRLIPYNIAAEMLFTGDFIDAAEAHRIGLVNRVVPQGELKDSARELAEKIARHPPLTLRALKEALLRSYELPLNQGLRMEGLLRRIIGGTEDAAEGVRAFAEGREPEFRGK